MLKTLLIPGLLCDSTVWQPLLSVLEKESTRVADLSTQEDLTVMASDCLAQNAGPVQVAGHSMGARVALEMARLAPDRVQRLVLLDTGIHPLRPGEIEQREESVQFAREHGMQAQAERWLKGMVHLPNQDDSHLMQRLMAMVMRCDADLYARQIKALINRPDASLYVTDVNCPVLLVAGRHDQWSPVAQHEDMLHLLPDARLEIVENAGHFAPLEQADTVAALIKAFFADTQHH